LLIGAVYGIAFAALGRTVRPGLLVISGPVYGLAVFALSSFVLLPIAAAITGSVDVISHMARMVGWPTFALEHMLFGAVLGGVVLLARRHQQSTARVEAHRPSSIAA
jgi:hypothetical protein